MSFWGVDARCLTCEETNGTGIVQHDDWVFDVVASSSAFNAARCIDVCKYVFVYVFACNIDNSICVSASDLRFGTILMCVINQGVRPTVCLQINK